ncbi:MAG: hypothetical protein FWD69_14910 [Polyangiaceae bacterium]|nr:hypothetical protein [Polyangiaceae bacterium]
MSFLIKLHWLPFVVFALLTGCRDLSRFSTTNGNRFEGPIVQGSFVRAGIAEDARMCMTLDTDHLQDTPGFISSSGGLFAQTPLRPIPQLWHDSLSTLSFGEGRIDNLIYAATPADDSADVLVVVSLMQSKDIEVRLLRGAPGSPVSGESEGGVSAPLFGIFNLTKQQGACQ